MSKKTISQSLFYYLFSAFGISLTIKAMIGVSSFNSLNVAISAISDIKVGTITTIINCIFLLLCWLFDHKRKVSGYLIMLIALLLFGNVINLFYYALLEPLQITNYVLRIIIFIIGALIGGFGTGKVLALQLLKFPIEHFCNLIAARTSHSFKFYRYSIDGICIVASIGLSWVYHLPLYVREGTLISLFLLSYMINWAKESRFKINIFQKSK